MIFSVLGVPSLTYSGLSYDDSWHHVVYTDTSTSSAGGAGVLYVDGVSRDTNGSMTQRVTDASAMTRLAALPWGSRRFGGSIDEVTIWEGVITSGMVTELYGGGAPTDPTTLSGSPPTLYSWHRMGDDASDVAGDPGTIIDQQGNADLTTHGMTSGDKQADVPT